MATSAERYCGGEQNTGENKNNMECPLVILHPKNNKQNLVISIFIWDALNAPADKLSQISCKRMLRKLAFNLLSAAEIHEITLLRKQSSAAPCGHRLRWRYQNSAVAIADAATSLAPEERGLGWEVEPSLAKEGRGDSKKSYVRT